MAGTRRMARAALGTLAAGLALGPLAAVAAAQDDGGFEYKIEPPDELSDFEIGAPLLSDAGAEIVIDLTDTEELIGLFTGGVGIPDIAPGEPGDLDLPPGTRVIDIEPVGPDTNGDGLPDQANVTLGTDAIAVDTDVETLGGGGSFLQGHCGGLAVSYGADDEILDAALGIGAGGDGGLIDIEGDNAGQRAFTESNPFQVRPDGQVVYFGFLPYTGGDGPRNHVWEITTAGISMDSGGDDNPDGNNANAGIVDLGDNIPAAARFTGVFPVQGWFFSENGLFCIAEGWVEFTGPFPLFTAPGAVAAFMALGGIAGLLFNSRPAQTFRV